MNILITGSSSLLGKSIAKKLANKKNKIICTYNKNYPKELNKFENINLKKLDLEKKIKKIKNIEVIIHCASAVPADKFSFNKLNKINYIGFKNLLKNTVDKTKTKKIILISTMSIYGKIKDKKINENYNGSKIDNYGKTKKKMENYLIKFSKTKNYIPIIFRLPGIVGKNSKNNFISSVIKSVKYEKEVIFSNPEFKFNNLIHVRNIAEIIRDSIKIEKKFAVYNLASTKPIKLINVINKIFFYLKKKKIYKILKSGSKPFQISLKKELVKKYKIYSVAKTLKLACKDNL